MVYDPTTDAQPSHKLQSIPTILMLHITMTLLPQPRLLRPSTSIPYIRKRLKATVSMNPPSRLTLPYYHRSRALLHKKIRTEQMIYMAGFKKEETMRLYNLKSRPLDKLHHGPISPYLARIPQLHRKIARIGHLKALRSGNYRRNQIRSHLNPLHAGQDCQ